MSHLRTSESVTEGHPDKLADQISDAILDEHLAQDPYSRVAVETLVTTNLIVLAGEVTSSADVHFETIARRVALEVGYDSPEKGLDGNTCEVVVRIHRQAPEIGAGVDRGGAGDQGVMFGFACDETPELMPAPISIAHALTRQAALVRRERPELGLRPDGKSQVTVQYDEDRPTCVRTVVLSLQHDPDMGPRIADIATEHVLRPVQAMYPHLDWTSADVIVNPSGSFVEGGPGSDTGLTGRKIIVDTYGGAAPHGGGAFSGKDPTKVDRSAAYLARLAAKEIVGAGLARRALVSVSYAIGREEPVMVELELEGGPADHEEARRLLAGFDFRPGAIIERLQLLRPIFLETARNGHFGQPSFPWESCQDQGASDAATEDLDEELDEESDEPDYPEPFETGDMDTGSRTIDTGHEFTIEVSDDGFEAVQRFGPWSREDLESVSYWPHYEQWTGSSESLAALAAVLAEENGYKVEEVMALLTRQFVECEEVPLEEFLAEETADIAAGRSPTDRWQRWPDLHDARQILGLQSHSGCDYGECDGIELYYDEDGTWSATLFVEDGDTEMFHPEFFSGKTFDELLASGDCGDLIGHLPWTREELAERMIEDDPRWEPFLRPGFRWP